MSKELIDMERMMTSDSHNRGSERDYIRGQKEKDAKVNGIQRQLRKEEYEREKDDIVVHLQVLMEMLQRNEVDQKNGYVVRKKVKWQRLQEKRNHQVNMQLMEEIRELEQVIDAKQRIEELERIELQQKEDVEVLICYPESGPLHFESDEEIEEFNHMNDSKQLEDLMIEASNKTGRTCDFKTNDLCMIAGLEEDKQSFKTVKEVEEYLPKNKSFEAEYDKEAWKESVQYHEQVMEDIIEIDDENERLADHLKSYLTLNQHTDVLTKELTERSEQHTEVFPKGKEVQRPYMFDYNDCLIIEDVVAEAGTYFAQVDSQRK